MQRAETDAPTRVLSLADPPPVPRRRRRTVRLAAAAVAVVLAAGGVTVAFVRHRDAAGPAPQPVAAAETAKIERRDLSTTRTLDGAVGYGTAVPLSGHRAATVTWLPRPGATIKRGRQLYRADDLPVALFYGVLPLYRPVKGSNLVGRDVRIIADNLAALGYRIGRQPEPGESVAGPGTATKPGTTGAPQRVGPGDGVLTPALTDAIRRWQRDQELPVTGTVAVGDVEVQPGAVRVDAVAAQLGSPSNAPLLSVTPTRKVVTVNTGLADAGSISRGDKVVVELPDDSRVPARVTAVGRDLAPVDGGADESPKLAVTVTADKTSSLQAIDSGKVKVNFTGRTVRGVLGVPIEALVALAENGYAVQGPAGLVAVRTGMFADGWVEIEGPGLTEGMEVVIAS